ncbi:MAG: hypothetical protein HQL30_09970 [Candidatus Omnitrophica bacterium]|nr:hypothetical protein [Candidatus Omnitrophota bacterium]
MKIKAGLWIDHKKAVIVAITEKGEETRSILSKVEKHLVRSGDSPLKGSYETRRAAQDDIRQREFTEHINIFYDAVIACLRNAEHILIFGPGEAKGELRKRLERASLGGLIEGVETVGKMTGPQIAAKVRERFKEAVSADAS